MNLFRALALGLLISSPIVGQSRSHARSMVISQSGIVASSQPLASQAGARILAAGGSAIDAAIATNAVLAVTEPMMNGLGGDLFVMYWDVKAHKLIGLNASGPAPQGLSIEYLEKHGHHRMPSAGIQSVTVPGAVDGWSTIHKRYGKLPWAGLFRDAIRYAGGFPVAETIQWQWNDSTYQQALFSGSDEHARAVFLPAPELGQVFRNPEMASAFQLLAAQGPRAFYEGAIAKAILKTSDRLGGTLQASDLAKFHSEWVEPISSTYRGWTVHELPPNGQGIAVLQMLNILETFPLPEKTPHSAEVVHTQIEAMKASYADLSHVADPRVSTIPLAGMLSKDYAKERAKLIDPDRAQCNWTAGVPPTSSNTVYLTVVDKEGNMASWIQSISGVWGSGVVVDGMGFALQNRGANFDFDRNHPNALAPGKRPRHTIIPAFMDRGDERIAFGIMGGMNQPMAHAQFISNVADYGMNIQAAMEAPRFTKAYLGGCDLLVEGRLKPDVIEALKAKGHELTVLGDYATAMGRGQAILRNEKTKVNYAASSPQGDGAAIPQP
jgi:gamma-glutamyltranspeptidase/glutathione hydrolase